MTMVLLFIWWKKQCIWHKSKAIAIKNKMHPIYQCFLAPIRFHLGALQLLQNATSLRCFCSTFLTLSSVSGANTCGCLYDLITPPMVISLVWQAENSVGVTVCRRLYVEYFLYKRMRLYSTVGALWKLSPHVLQVIFTLKSKRPNS